MTKDDHHHDTESSFHSPPRVEFSSNLTRDFSGAFDLKTSEEPPKQRLYKCTEPVILSEEPPPKQRLSFAGALMTQTAASQTSNKTSCSSGVQEVRICSAGGKEVTGAEGDCYLKPEPIPTIIETPRQKPMEVRAAMKYLWIYMDKKRCSYQKRAEKLNKIFKFLNI